MNSDSTEYRIEVLRLSDEAEQCYAKGDLAGAIVRLQRGCDLLRDAAGKSARDADNAQQLGSMLYALGEWLLQVGDHEAAVSTLIDAEAEYKRLGTDGAQLVADAVISRTRVLVTAARPLSAIAEAQQAVTAASSASP